MCGYLYRQVAGLGELFVGVAPLLVWQSLCIYVIHPELRI